MSKPHEHVSDAEAGFVLSTLEPGQLARAAKVAVPRRQLRGSELVLLWGLRIYVVFMMAVVFWQAWTSR